MFIGLGTAFWGNAIFMLPMNSFFIEGEFLPYYIKLLPNLFVFGGALSGWILYLYLPNFLFNIKMILTNFYIFLNKKWFFDKLYNELIAENFLNFSFQLTYKIIDKGFLEILGPKEIVNIINLTSYKIKKLHNGLIIVYAFYMFFICFLLYFNIYFELFIIIIYFIFI